jgi:hypothetical protein
LFIHRGLDPRLVDELPWRDVEAYLAIEDRLAQRYAFGGFPEG